MEEKEKSKVDLGKEVGSLARYRKELAATDKEIFDKLLGYAKNHASACAKSEQGLLESMLLAIVLEQQKMIEALNAERGDPRTRNPGNEIIESRTSNLTLPTLYSSGTLEGPPWVC